MIPVGLPLLPSTVCPLNQVRRVKIKAALQIHQPVPNSGYGNQNRISVVRRLIEGRNHGFASRRCISTWIRQFVTSRSWAAPFLPSWVPTLAHRAGRRHWRGNALVCSTCLTSFVRTRFGVKLNLRRDDDDCAIRVEHLHHLVTTWNKKRSSWPVRDDEYEIFFSVIVPSCRENDLGM